MQRLNGVEEFENIFTDDNDPYLLKIVGLSQNVHGETEQNSEILQPG
jgi:hypothetical protein